MGGVRCTMALVAFVLVFFAGCETLTDPKVGSQQSLRASADRLTAASSNNPPAQSIASPPVTLAKGESPLSSSTPAAEASETPLPINLATALQLANVRPLDVQIAGRLVEASAATLARARVLWVPNLDLGGDYLKHIGPQQTTLGVIDRSTHEAAMVGLGPYMVFSFSDAIFAPLAARQDLRGREAIQQAALNDVSLAVTEAYFGVQQARGDLAAAAMAVKYADDVARKTQSLFSKGIAPPSEVNRANAELGRRKQLVSSARERWRTSSAELTRLLRLDPNAIVEPIEPPFLPITVIDPMETLDSLIPIALGARPELAEHQAIVQAALARLKQEKIRPLVPSLAIRSASTTPSGTLGYGLYGGGTNGNLGDFGARMDIDFQLVWELEALGFGNRARVRERRAEHEAAILDLFRTQDRVAAEVATAFAQARSAAERANEAEPALREAIELAKKTVEELGQTRRIGDTLVLLLRPQEAVAAVQAFAQATEDFYGAIADYNRAQFRLYRALGHPAQCLANAVPKEASQLLPAQPGSGPNVPRVDNLPPVLEAGLPRMEPTMPSDSAISVYPRVDVAPSVVPVSSPPPPSVRWTTVPVDAMPRVPTAPVELPSSSASMPLPLRPPIVVSEREP